MLPCLVIVIFFPLQSQSNLKKANELFKKEEYSRAIPYFDKYLNNYVDSKALVNRAKCHYYSHNLNACIRDLENANILRYEKADLDLYMARAYHHMMEFELAILYYKKHLSKILKDESARKAIVKEIKHCSNGINLSYMVDNCLIENLGKDFNSMDADFNLVQSPNIIGKYYFNRKEKYRGGKHCIYSTITSERGMTNAITFNPRYGFYDEILTGIAEDGSYLFLGRFNAELGKFQLFKDLFDPNSGPFSQTKAFEGPFNYEVADSYMHIIDDSTFLFSSDQLGGYGGFDLFIWGKRNGKWSKAINLGPEINSKYDEIHPFLSKDGKHLFFSSDRKSSIGGFDVFINQFDQENKSWGQTRNAGLPLNSAGDDIYFKISYENNKAFISSDRKDMGFGKLDLYQVFLLDSTLIANHNFPIEPFYDDFNFQAFRGLEEELVQTEYKDQEMDTVWIENNPFSELLDDEVNLQKLDRPLNAGQKTFSIFIKDSIPNDAFFQKNEIINFVLAQLDENPGLKIKLISHTKKGKSRTEDLNLAMLRLYKVVALFIGEGIKMDRILLNSAGSEYPMAGYNVGESQLMISQPYNERIDLQLMDTEKDAALEIINPYVPPHLKSGDWLLYQSILNGLSYKLEVLPLKEIKNIPFLNVLKDCYISYAPESSEYILYSGIFRNYAEAFKRVEILRKQHFIDAHITPFLNGIKIDESQIQELSTQYLDLNNLLEKK